MVPSSAFSLSPVYSIAVIFIFENREIALKKVFSLILGSLSAEFFLIQYLIWSERGSKKLIQLLDRMKKGKPTIGQRVEICLANRFTSAIADLDFYASLVTLVC